MRNSYSKEDVEILLEDLSGTIEQLGVREREQLIQSGIHYSQMLPKEEIPDKEYISIYNSLLEKYSKEIARNIIILGDKLYRKHKGELILISLARAGTPVGILLKRYIKLKYKKDIPHYSISIIRGKGIDKVAMEYIYNQHKEIPVTQYQFIDGWIGKGAINNVLKDACKDLEKEDKWKGINSELGVISDPVNITELCGTHKDLIIPSACLNSTVSGLISRTILNERVESLGSFHGAVYMGHLKEYDVSNDFIDRVTRDIEIQIENNIELNTTKIEKSSLISTSQILANIMRDYNIQDINLIKPGVCETTRVLLRRIPWKILINKNYILKDIPHIHKLCKEKGIKVEEYELGNYISCGLIEDLGISSKADI